MPLVLGGQSATAAAFSIDNSCRFNDNDSAMLEITPASTSDAIRKTWTFSVWFKIGNLGAEAGRRRILFPRTDGSNYADMWLETDDTFSFNDYQSGTQFNFVTTQVFRDTGAWYHLVIAMDTTQAVEANRTKIYLNGTQITDFGTETYPAQDTVTMYNSDSLTRIGNNDGSTYFDGYFAQIAMVTASQLAPTSFGEFNSDSPTIWQPIDISGLTFGTNGYFLDFADSAALGDDVSGNGNDWTPSGLAAVDQCLDSPTNNFATLNLSQNYYDPGVFTQGNCTLTTAGGVGMYSFRTTTLGMSKSKWYMEFRKTTGDTNAIWGYASEFPTANNNYVGENVGNYGLDGLGVLRTNAGTVSTGWGTFTTGYVMLAIDLDNNFIYFGTDGTWLKSGDPTSGPTGTGGESITAASASTIGHYFFAMGDFSNTSGYVYECNFGNGSFGDTAAGATNADDNDQGIFKYDVPTGYYALCTKNLAEFG